MKTSDLKAPKIAIIVPIFNVAAFLPQAIESCINQTYKNLEIILVDDGSIDNSGQIAFKYFLSDTRCVLIKKPNGGLSSARNAGLEYLCNNLNLDAPLRYDAKDFEYSIFSETQKQDSKENPAICDVRENPDSIESNNAQNLDSKDCIESRHFYVQKGYYVYKGCFEGADSECEAILLNQQQEVYVFSHASHFAHFKSEDSKDLVNLECCKYFHLLDSDDELEIDCIQDCVETLNETLNQNKFLKTETTAIWHNFSNINENGNVILDNVIGRFTEFHEYQILQNTQLLDFKTRNMIAMCWSALFPLDSIKKNTIRFMDFVHSEDQLFSFMILCNLENVIYTPKSLYRYRQRSDSTMNFNPHIHAPPTFLKPLYAHFRDAKLGKEYYIGYSFCVMGYGLWRFSMLSSNARYKDRLQKGVMTLTPRRIKVLRCIDIEGSDPKNARALITRLSGVLPRNFFKKTYLFPSYNRLLYRLQKLKGTLKRLRKT